MAEREKYHPGLGKKDKRWAGAGKASAGGGALKPSASNNKPAAVRVAAKKPAASKAAKPAADSGSAKSAKEIQELKTQVAEKTEAATDLQLNIDALEKERDFYFGKLRDIEILCQEREGDQMDDNLSTLVDAIKAIMYATDDTAEAAEAVEDEVEDDDSY